MNIQAGVPIFSKTKLLECQSHREILHQRQCAIKKAMVTKSIDLIYIVFVTHTLTMWKKNDYVLCTYKMSCFDRSLVT